MATFYRCDYCNEELDGYPAHGRYAPSDDSTSPAWQFAFTITKWCGNGYGSADLCDNCYILMIEQIGILELKRLTAEFAQAKLPAAKTAAPAR